MAKNIEPKLRKIGDYLKLEDEAVFEIPEYQRPYSWEIINCDKLWQDILEYIDEGCKDRYFFGTIIINCQDNDTKYSLIDGQQRTTTFLLLLKALLMRINVAIGKTESDPDSESLCRGLKARRIQIMSILYKAEAEDIPDKPEINTDRKICNSFFILNNKSINEMYKSELQIILSSVEYNEVESKVYKIEHKKKNNRFTNFFKNFKYYYDKATELSASELNNIAKTIIESCEVIEIKSWQVDQAIKMFNSLNSSGLPLCDADIISAQLYASADKKQKSEVFNKLWGELIELSDYLKQRGISDINSIFMQQMYYERAKNANNEIITETGAIDVTTPGLRRFFTEINPDLLKEPIVLCTQLLNLAKIWDKISDYPFIQVLLKFNDNAKLFLGCYLQRFTADNITENDIQEFSLCLLRLFTILELIDTGYSSSAFKTFLFKESVKLVDINVHTNEIKDDFDNHISEKWNADDIKKNIVDYDKNMIIYLNEYLFAKEKGLTFDLGTKYDIEHIMPQSGANIDAIRKDAKIESIDEFYAIVNKIGNKILLEQKINRSIGNEWFRTKVSTKLSAKTGYIDSKYPLATYLVKEYQNDTKAFWFKNDIEKATDIASDRIVKFIFG